MEKDCKTCYYRYKSIADDPCYSCHKCKCSENVVGVVYSNWKLDDKKINWFKRLLMKIKK